MLPMIAPTTRGPAARAHVVLLLLLLLGAWCMLAPNATPCAAAADMSWWTVFVDDQPVPGELPPVTVGPHLLLVSARSLCQRLGADYSYDPASGKVVIKKASVRIELKDGAALGQVNGRSVTVGTAPHREGGAMMVPVPFVPQALGCKVKWNDDARMVALTTPEGSTPAAPSADPGASTAPAPVAPLAVLPIPSAWPSLTTPAAVPTAPPAPTPPASTPPPGLGFPGGRSGMEAMDPAAMPSVNPNSPAGFAPEAIPGKVGIGAANTAFSGGSTPPAIPEMIPGATMPPMGPAGPGDAPYDPAAWRTRAGANADLRYPTAQEPALPDLGGHAGTMDTAEQLQAASYDPTLPPMPDPAITGLTMDRRYDNFYTAYTVHYRITNLGTAPVQRALLVRLLVGGSGPGDMQIVQDIKIDKLAVAQSVDFEWEGDTRSYPVLYGVVVRAEARVMLSQGEADARANNNTRKLRLAY